MSSRILALLCLLSFLKGSLTSGADIGVRALLNQGIITSPHQCAEGEFETVKLAIQSSLAAPIDRLRSLQPVNCARVCCGFAYGTCVVYYPRCYGYPTPSSNQDCRRQMFDDQRMLGVSEDDLKECNEMKESALKAILDAVKSVSPSCTDFLLSPTLLECYSIDASNTVDTVEGSDEPCSIATTGHDSFESYGSIMVGFDGPVAVLDFADTDIDLSVLSDVWGDDGLFSKVEVIGTNVVLSAKDDSSLSLENRVQVHFSSHHPYSGLSTLGSSAGLPSCYLLEEHD